MDEYQYMRGQTIGGRYLLEKPLGFGGMAEVWKAKDQRLQSDVAVKFMHFGLLREVYRGAPCDDGGSNSQRAMRQLPERFMREFRTAGQLIRRYPKNYLVGIFDMAMDEYGNLYYVMEYVSGCPLSDEICRCAQALGLLSETAHKPNQPPRGRVAQSVYPIFDLYRITDQLLDVLGYLHGNGGVHRDIKPDNIMLVRDSDGRPSIRLLDFGVAKWAEAALSAAQAGERSQFTVVGTQMGSPAYMPEELFCGKSRPDETGKQWEAGSYTDLYAVAVLLFEAVAGCLPYSFSNPQEFAREVQDWAKPVSDPGLLVEDLNPKLREVILKGLAKRPWQRYQEAAVMRNDLRQAEKIDRERLRISADFPTMSAAVPLSFQPTMIRPSQGDEAVPVAPPTAGAAQLSIKREPAPPPSFDGVPALLEVPPPGPIRTTLRSVADDDPPPRRGGRVVKVSAVIAVALMAAGGFLFGFRSSLLEKRGTQPSASFSLVQTVASPSADERLIPSSAPVPTTRSPSSASTVSLVQSTAAPPTAGANGQAKRMPELPSPAALQALKTGRMIAMGPVKDCVGALPFFEEARRAAPDWPDVYLEIGECQRKLGRLEPARDAFRAYRSFEGAKPLPPPARALIE